MLFLGIVVKLETLQTWKIGPSSTDTWVVMRWPTICVWQQDLATFLHDRTVSRGTGGKGWYTGTVWNCAIFFLRRCRWKNINGFHDYSLCHLDPSGVIILNQALFLGGTLPSIGSYHRVAVTCWAATSNFITMMSIGWLANRTVKKKHENTSGLDSPALIHEDMFPQNDLPKTIPLKTSTNYTRTAYLYVKQKRV